MRWITIILVFLLSINLTAIADDKAVMVLSNYAMKYSIETSASKETIWHLWSDVENWEEFDEHLEYSKLIDDVSFSVGDKGIIKSKGAPRTVFELTNVDRGKSFTEVLKLPLWQTVHLKRYFEVSPSGKTIFTQEVIFKGGLRSIYHALFGGAFKKDLPLVMMKMKYLAEQKEQKILKRVSEPIMYVVNLFFR